MYYTFNVVGSQTFVNRIIGTLLLLYAFFDTLSGMSQYCENTDFILVTITVVSQLKKYCQKYGQKSKFRSKTYFFANNQNLDQKSNFRTIIIFFQKSKL